MLSPNVEATEPPTESEGRLHGKLSNRWAASISQRVGGSVRRLVLCWQPWRSKDPIVPQPGCPHNRDPLGLRGFAAYPGLG